MPFTLPRSRRLVNHRAQTREPAGRVAAPLASSSTTRGSRGRPPRQRRAAARAIDAATTADHEAAQVVDKRNELFDRTRTKLVVLKRFAAVVLAGRSEIAVFRRAMPSLVRKGRRVRTKAADPAPLPVPPTGDKPVAPTA